MLMAAAMVVFFVLCFLVFNLSYFIASKLFFGYEVTEFYLGNGRELTGFTIGRTKFALRLFPITAGVHFNNNDDIGWKSVIFSAVGPLGLIAFAIAILTALYTTGYPETDNHNAEPVIDYVLPGSPAAKAGLLQGDRILRIGQQNSPTWGDVVEQEVSSPAKQLALIFRRGGSDRKTTVVPEQDNCWMGGFAGWSHLSELYVRSMSSSSPAQGAGIKKGDIIVAINKKPVHSVLELGNAVRSSDGRPMTFDVLRNGSIKSVQVTPKLEKEASSERFTIGAALGATLTPRTVRLPFTAAMHLALRRNLESARLLFVIMADMLSGKPTSSLQIRQNGGGSATIIEFVGLVALNLGVFNLLPLPICPGGAMVVNTAQALRRRPISKAVKERFDQISLVLFVLLVAVIVYHSSHLALRDLHPSKNVTPVRYYACSSSQV